jgi:hypothetical protein
MAGCAFTQVLVDQQPYYDRMILEDMTPVDTWIGSMEMGTFEAFTGVEHTLDRFTDVFPDTTQAWNRVQSASCIGAPCDPTRNVIGFGAKRITYFLEQQNWQTDLLCFDQEMHVTHAKEHLAQIIGRVLRPATSAIMSEFMRKRALLHAGKTWQANAQMSDFTFQFTTVGTQEIYFDCSVSPTNVFKLTPQMLQRRFTPLMNIGYGGMNPFSETAPFIELVTDLETAWELDRLGGQTGVGGSTPSIGGNWRFEQWESANKFWRYGYSGQLGNFMVRTDLRGLRFNFVQDLGAGSAPNRYRYQVVIPYVNVATSGAGGAPGLQRQYNSAFENAHFTISFIWHKRGMKALVADASPVNPQMPFSSRNFGGKWQFVMDNLGADKDGKAIANYLRNKGMFVADFKLAIQPLMTEFVEGIFHKREPMCVYNVDTCSADPGYPTQSYADSNAQCPSSGTYSFTFTPNKSVALGTYEIVGNTVLCDETPVAHDPITGTSTLATLVAQLNARLSELGTFAVAGSTITLTSSYCVNVTLPFQA